MHKSLNCRGTRDRLRLGAAELAATRVARGAMVYLDESKVCFLKRPRVSVLRGGNWRTFVMIVYPPASRIGSYAEPGLSKVHATTSLQRCCQYHEQSWKASAFQRGVSQKQCGSPGTPKSDDVIPAFLAACEHLFQLTVLELLHGSPMSILWCPDLFLAEHIHISWTSRTLPRRNIHPRRSASIMKTVRWCSKTDNRLDIALEEVAEKLVHVGLDENKRGDILELLLRTNDMRQRKL